MLTSIGADADDPKLLVLCNLTYGVDVEACWSLPELLLRDPSFAIADVEGPELVASTPPLFFDLAPRLPERDDDDDDWLFCV